MELFYKGTIFCVFSGTRSLPIHCIIEQTSGPPSFDNQSLDEKSTHSNVELDSYAILPGTTPITECVQSALTKLGYNATEALGAKGKFSSLLPQYKVHFQQKEIWL